MVAMLCVSIIYYKIIRSLHAKLLLLLVTSITDTRSVHPYSATIMLTLETVHSPMHSSFLCVQGLQTVWRPASGCAVEALCGLPSCGLLTPTACTGSAGGEMFCRGQCR
jgi:hypothetical protein